MKIEWGLTAIVIDVYSDVGKMSYAIFSFSFFGKKCAKPYYQNQYYLDKVWLHLLRKENIQDTNPIKENPMNSPKKFKIFLN